MTYTTKKVLSSSEKNYLMVLTPAIIVSNWTLDSGTVYYNDFSVSDEFIEYVVNVTNDGIGLTSVSSAPTSGQFWWDFANRRLYINIGVTPTVETLVVFFEIHFGTKTAITHRNPLDSSTDEVYYPPRLTGSTIPAVDQIDFLAFGTSQGSANLINSDAAFYIYNDASFRNKQVKIYHYLDDISNIKLYYKGQIEDVEIDDTRLRISYRQKDFVFNNKVNSYLPTGTDTLKGFLRDADFANLDPSFQDYAVRVVYGRVDDMAPINIDFSDNATTSNNRQWVVRSDASNPHTLNYTVLASPTSTTTRIYIGAHFLQEKDALKVTISAVPEYTWVTAVGVNYVDVSPAITAPSSGDSVDRSSIGFVTIKRPDGTLHQLALGRDYTETTFANNTLGFTLANNFETNHSFSLFEPLGDVIFCRCYGKKHSTTNDSDTGNMTAAHLILVDLFEEYLNLDTDDFNKTEIEGLSTQALGFTIPEQNSATYPSYRDIITKINRSVLGQIYFDTDEKISYRLIGPLGTSQSTLTDKQLLSFSIELDGTDIYNKISVFYNTKETPNGSFIKSHSRNTIFSSKASYLHEVENTLDVFTFLSKSADATTVGNRYKIIHEDWKRTYSVMIKTQLNENVTGEAFTIEREKLLGFNYVKETDRTKDVALVRFKKGLTETSISFDDQKNIEDNSGSW